MKGPRVNADGVYFVDIEIGMPLTGRNNLAETPLLKMIGDIRWKHLAELTGLSSKDVVDETGERLYATFYYVEIRFPKDRPMASFGENDRFTIVNTVQSYENSIIDGYHFLFPADWPHEKTPPATGTEAIQMGIPYVRSSNAFVRMVQGASWLKKASPIHAGMNEIPRIDRTPETYLQILNVSEQGYFEKPPRQFLPLTPGQVMMHYRPEPDRDLNGVGLLYFANYPLVLDLAERALLPEQQPLAIGDELLDLRTVVRRQSAYLCNICPTDTIDVYLQAWIENPFAGNVDPAGPLRLFLNYELFRRSDRRKMLISTAEKVIYGPTLQESGLMESLKDLAGQESTLHSIQDR